ncbi:S8 family serine peptidase [Rapidithrix thailandica]|uniref:S8 family serine peptidase n=1 Tax=Rapidithrix thailandica TaxID=413964 RepID=A0AAW9RTV6_9BACT
MKNEKASFILCCSFLLTFLTSAFIDVQGQSKSTYQVIKKTDVKALNELRKSSRKTHKSNLKKALKMAGQKGWPLIRLSGTGQLIRLRGVTETGMPVYHITNNEIAAKTINTDQVWEGGDLGLQLSGQSMPDESLGIWEVGATLRLSHVEFGGRVHHKDGNNPEDNEGSRDHATHVAGTLIGQGINSSARGMAHKAELSYFDSDNDLAEMADAATSGMLVSNHSYGFATGWEYDFFGDGRWVWLGDPSVNTEEDWRFGFYDNEAANWDQVAFEAPYYTIVKAAGNHRNNSGPSSGEAYWVYTSGGDTTLSTVNRLPDGGINGYDCLSDAALAKNVISVGAVHGIPNTYSKPSDVIMTGFSSWGPTDDGRIKPDLVAQGYQVLSSASQADNAYKYLSGTSMAAPTVAGSVYLLQEHYYNHFGNFMKSATVRGVLIHTAEETGTQPGPDYQYGWGLMNTAAAAEVISGSGSETLIQEKTLENQRTEQITIYASGNEPLMATLCWTDPQGNPVSKSLDPQTIMLVNDLDIKIERNGTPYRPWVLDPANPSTAATRGNNIRDNVEKVLVENPEAGLYTLTISHKGSLQNGKQAYSLIVSGVISQAVDAKIEKIYAETDPCNYSDATPVKVLVSNNGRNDLQNLKVSYQVRDDKNTLLLDGNQTISDLSAGSETLIHFSADFLEKSICFITAVVTVAGDENSENNVLLKEFKNPKVYLNGQAYQQDLESVDALSNWISLNSNADVDVNNTPHTWNYIPNGPNARSGESYYSYYGSGTNQAANDWFITGCFYLEKGRVYRMNFWQKQQIAGNTQRVEVFVGKAQSSNFMTQKIFAYSGQPGTAYEYQQTQFSVAESGTYYLGWKALSPANQNNYYIDDIEIGEAFGRDLAVVDIQPLLGSCDFNEETPVEIKISNVGTTDVQNATLFYSYLSASGNEVTGSTPVGELTNGQVKSLVVDGNFAKLVNAIDFKVIVQLEGEENTENDTLSITFPARFNFGEDDIYKDDFEDNATFGNWQTEDANQDGITWEFIDPSVGVPSFAHSGSGFVALEGNGSQAADDWLYSTCLYLRPNTNYAMTFYHRVAMADSPAKLEIKLGSSQEAVNMTKSLKTMENLSGTEYRLASVVFSVEEEGVYYLGLHSYSEANQATLLLLDDIQIGLLEALGDEGEQPDEARLILYPNPTQGSYSVELNNAFIGTVKMNIRNSVGSLVKSMQIDKRTERLEVSGLDLSTEASGLYLIEFQMGAQRVVKRIIKK